VHVDEDPVAGLMRAVLERNGAIAEQAEPLLGGEMNHTWRAPRRRGGDVVLRVPRDSRRADVFPVEFWATRAAGRAGIPIAPPLTHGVHRGMPFMLSEFVEPDPRPTGDPWTWLGRTARAIGAVDVGDAPSALYSRFGSDLAQAWSAHLEYNLAALDGDDPLRHDRAYEYPSVLRRRFRSLQGERFVFGLAHGDLAPRNLISRGPGRAPVLIDWGAAETGPAPWTDARRVVEWAFVDGSIPRDDAERFLVGAGLGGEEARETLLSMTALHLIDVTRWAREIRPDLSPDSVERCRLGLERLSLA